MQTLLFVQDNAQHSGQDQHFTFSTRFELHPTPRGVPPAADGEQTPHQRAAGAIVTGPAGEEIWTDQYGRVRYSLVGIAAAKWMKTAPAGYASIPVGGQRLQDDPDPRIGQVLVDFKTAAIRIADHRGAYLQPGHHAAVGTAGNGVAERDLQPLAVWRANERQHAAF